MNDLMSVKKVSSFSRLLAAYGKVNGGNRFDAIDGGAGAGTTAREMLQHLGPAQKVYAFEPFPGNHRFFKPEETRILLHKQALAAGPGQMCFRVPSTVAAESAWGQQGLAGYSSVGYLVPGAAPREGDLNVDCVAAQDVVTDHASIGFIKLDLQGGELGALQGMAQLLSGVQFMWVEFTHQPGLVEFLADHDFLIFDTEYFFFGTPGPEAANLFDIIRTGVGLSTGATAWFGYRRRPWLNYTDEFRRAQRDFGLVQTDLVCINRSHVDLFIAASQHL